MVRDLGLIAYPEAMTLQDALVEERLRGEIPDTLLLLEHPPVITLGRRASLADVYLSEADLARRGIALERTSRGGLVTYHGPGQLVGYPIVHLRQRGLTVPCYVRALELAIVDALGEIGVEAHLDAEHIGVWTPGHGKIAAIGVAQRHGVTLHGFAVNLQPDLSHFGLINPCGIGDLGVTSVSAVLGHEVDISEFKSRIAARVSSYLEEPARARDCLVEAAVSSYAGGRRGSERSERRRGAAAP
ncbi:MAG: lipoyl(octanoyl) transferase LipB [Chloroflexi bacterium]|nr:lipoyl(octanoyl) transferase LipB [Chloroflexota bacterium]